MRIRQLTPVALLALAAIGCDADKILDGRRRRPPSRRRPRSAIPQRRRGGRGMYDSLGNGRYYGDRLRHLRRPVQRQHVAQRHVLDVPERRPERAPRGQHDRGGHLAADLHGINNANASPKLPARLPRAATRNQYVGEAYFLRALGHHNALKFWGAVPVVPTRWSARARRAQRRARTRPPCTGRSSPTSTRRRRYMNVQKGGRAGLVGAARALRARVQFYRGDYAGALAAAQTVTALGYQLSPSYGGPVLHGRVEHERGHLPPPVRQRPDQRAELLLLREGERRSLRGRADGGAAQSQYGTADDARRVELPTRRERPAVWRQVPEHHGYGAPARHPLRRGVLIQAEALARLNRLTEALVPLNARPRARRRGGADDDRATQQSSITPSSSSVASSCAMEGDRWADLIRTRRRAALPVLQERGGDAGALPDPAARPRRRAGPRRRIPGTDRVTPDTNDEGPPTALSAAPRRSSSVKAISAAAPVRRRARASHPAWRSRPSVPRARRRS